MTIEEKRKQVQHCIEILNEVHQYEATSDPTCLSEDAKQYIGYCLAFDIPIKIRGDIIKDERETRSKT